jgi:hypothetical protein
LVVIHESDHDQVGEAFALIELGLAEISAPTGRSGVSRGIRCQTFNYEA